MTEHRDDELPTVEDVLVASEGEASDLRPLVRSEHDLAEIESGLVHLPDGVTLADQLPGEA